MPELESEANTPDVVTTGEDVVAFVSQMERAGIEIWVDGGWGVDALLDRQLRPHQDLDIAIEWNDVPRLREVLAMRGYEQVREDSQWNFVLADDAGHEIDVHAFVHDANGAVVEGVMYPAESLTGTGTIDGRAVRCIAPKYQLDFLAPWIHKWPEKYVEAVAALCEKFHMEPPAEYIQIDSRERRLL